MKAHVGRQAQRQAKAKWLLAGCALIGAVIGAGHALIEDMDVTLPRGLLFAGALLVLTGVFAASIAYWRAIDEAAREAHKFAWFWGGSTAMLVPVPVLLLLGEARLVTLFGQQSPLQWVLVGVGAVLFPSIVGYGLVWAGWWLRQR